MTSALASPAYFLYGVVMLQPQEIFQKRLGSADPLVAYVKAVGSAIDSFAAHHGDVPAASGFVVLAVKPGGQRRTWLDFDNPPAESILAPMRGAVLGVQPPDVSEGMIALALKIGLWGGKATVRATPMPMEWRAAAERAGQPLEVTQLIDKVW